MSMQQGISLRYKIWIILTLIPLVALGSYLVIAVKIFQKDKLAYVFDSSQTISSAMASQITNEFNNALQSSKAVLQDYLDHQEFSQVSRSVIKADPKILWISIYKKKAQNVFEQVSFIEKQSGLLDSFTDKVGPLVKLFPLDADQSRHVYKTRNEDKVLIAERIANPSNGDVFVFFLHFQIPQIAQFFKMQETFESFLVDQNGVVLFSPLNSDLENFHDFGELSFFSGENKFANGVEVLKRGKEEWLVAFSKVLFGDLYVVTTTEKKSALHAVQELMKTSVAFLILLISATTVISLFASSSLTQSLTELFLATKKVAEGIFDIRVKVTSHDEVGSLAQSFNAMAGEVSRLLEATAEKARMESELKTAQTVQETLFPAPLAEMNQLRIAGFYEPASECGGDWWHYCQVGKKVFLWIGDATGHGAPAALITSAAKSAASVLETLDFSASKCMEFLNRSIYDVAKGKMMMTFFIACYDSVTGELSYANASHESPFLIQRTKGNTLKKKDLIPLNEVNNPRLGQARDTHYKQATIHLNPGDRVLFYTDGIPDIENLQKKPWGEREFIKSILHANHESAVQTSVQTMVSQFKEFRKNAPLKDDITFFMVERLAQEKSSI
jgi:sigma-B regulation protein RsbU (phosphoserine phosphatase)